MEGDGYTTPLGSPRGQGGDPTDAPGAYDSPVNTVPLRNDNAVPPGAPRVDRTVAVTPFLSQLFQAYFEHFGSEEGVRQQTLREVMIAFPATTLDTFYRLYFERRATPDQWTALADMVVSGLDEISAESEQAVTFWFFQCSNAARDDFRASHPSFSPRPLPVDIYRPDGEGNVQVLRPRDDTRRILSFPGGAGWRPSAAQTDPEILKDQKAMTKVKRKRHEDGKSALEEFRASEEGQAGFDNTCPPSPAPHESFAFCDYHDCYFSITHGCAACNTMLLDAFAADQDEA